MTAVVETALVELYERAGGPELGVALAAVGSLARRELGPYSDVDLVLLHDGADLGKINKLAERLWYPIWDSKIKLDHSVRTPAECADVAAKELTAGVGLLDLRVIAGDAGLTANARSRLLDGWRSGARKRLDELIASIVERNQTFGDAAYLLEPDLKEARGGFRDMIMLRALAATWLTDRPHQSVRDPYAFLLDVRDALHLSAGRNVDRLLATEAPDVAQRLGFNSTDALDPTDGLHRSVSLAARRIGHAIDLTVREARQVVPARRVIGFSRRGRRPNYERAPHGLVVHLGEVSLDRLTSPSEPLIGLRAGALAAQRGLVLSPVTAEHLGNLAPALPDPWPDEARESLLAMLSTGPALPPVWEALELNGCIGRWIPQWELIKAEPQYNPIHRHTVDRHSVQTAIEAHRHLTAVERPDILLLACLFHDIGKGLKARGVAGVDHAAGGAPVAREIVLSLGVAAEDAALIELLVREHLTLATLATRRDHADPATVDALIAAVDGKASTLKLLRALTESDARAAGPQAWSPWRAQLINALGDRVLLQLEGEEVPADVGSEFGIGLARSVLLDGRPRIEMQQRPGGVELIIACADRVGLFSDTAGLLAAHQVTVRSAVVGTIGGVAVNTWRTDANLVADLPDRAYLAGELLRLADHDQRVLSPVRRREARAHRQDQPPYVQLFDSASRTAAVIEVRVTDRAGLLYALGAALAEAGLSIRSAHITTLAGQAIDTFYVTEPDDTRPSQDRCRRAVRILTEAAAGPAR
ncbi:[protein-PII] uridylyltransferase [Microlunatus elymi]|uniref:Bifunctional uridylyltransferase/uridylyl-removing enzyme n=1 Tax=Microlunatus elymi TaxID=2596828 RepID=A0A516PY53_9ACTN|nr:[protein-PII] uridylyltransferase [Microlunatus elymi]QDP96100.1 [protein-PII] uridylyltransferase [Microlunatus elymi]